MIDVDPGATKVKARSDHPGGLPVIVPDIELGPPHVIRVKVGDHVVVDLFDTHIRRRGGDAARIAFPGEAAVDQQRLTGRRDDERGLSGPPFDTDEIAL